MRKIFKIPAILLLYVATYPVHSADTTVKAEFACIADFFSLGAVVRDPISVVSTADETIIRCEVPMEKDLRLRFAEVRMEDSGRSARDTSCLLESYHALARRPVLQGPSVLTTGTGDQVLRLRPPRRSYRGGYWAISCDFNDFDRIYGIRYVYDEQTRVNSTN